MEELKDRSELTVDFVDKIIIYDINILAHCPN